MAKRSGCWSYNAGEAGKNWVRAFENARGGMLYLEWMESGRRRRMSLRTRDRAVAVRKAEELASRHGALEEAPMPEPGVLILDRLLTLYEQEVTPEKGEQAQDSDRRAFRISRTFFGREAVVERIRDGRALTELGRKRYNAFVKARREGRIEGFPRKVGERAVQADVQVLIAVFHWAMIEREDGTVLMQRNPWQGFPLPREKNPKRPPLTPEIEAKLLKATPAWRPRLALILCRETGRRLSAVRQIELPKINLQERWVEWDPRFDKNGLGRRTPLSERAVEAIRSALLERGIGGRWLFPAPEDPEQPASKDYFVRYMGRWKRRAGVDVPGLGYHAGKRSKIRDPEFRKLDPKIREALVDTTEETQRKVYDDVTFEDLKEAVG